MSNERVIENFNATIDGWISGLQQYRPESLVLKPDERSWSIGQLYVHILEETDWYMGQIQLCLGNADNITGGKKSTADEMFLKNEFPDMIIKGDPLTSGKIQQPHSTDQLQTGLKALRDQMNMLWNLLYHCDVKGKSEHPGLGYFSPEEWIQYAEMHMRHHLKQKDRIDTVLKLHD